MFLHALQRERLTNLESVLYLSKIVSLPIRAVDHSAMNAKIRAMTWWPNMQQLKLLTLRWPSFSGCGREHVGGVYLTKDNQYRINGCLRRFGTYLIQDAKLKIVDSTLPLILRMGRWLSCCHFCQWQLPVHQLCITATKSLCNYHTYKTTNCWRSVDAQYQNGVLTMLPSLLPIEPGDTSVIHNSDQITS